MNSSKKVLIVDDELEICLLLTRFLTSNGYSTSFVNTLNQARKTLEKTTPNVVVLDVNLPDGHGFDIVPLIKRNGKSKVICISAQDGLNEKTLNEKLNIDYFLRKPFSRKTILSTVEKITQS